MTCGVVAASAVRAAPVSAAVTASADISAYADRLIDNGRLPPVIAQDEATSDGGAGLPLRVSLSLRGTSQQSDANARVSSLDSVVQALLDTRHYGAWSVALTQRSNPKALFGRIDQRRMPFDGGWYLDNAWGMVTSAAPQSSASGTLSRFTVPVQSVFGMSSQWSHPARDQSMSVSVGERFQTGNDIGIGFERQGGRFVSVNAQSALSSALRLTAALTSAREPAHTEAAITTGDSGLLNATWKLGPAQIEANALASRTSARSSVGAWIEAQWGGGPLTHHATAFRFEPGLSWGTLSSIADLQGVSYRANYRSRQWGGEATAEVFRPVATAGKTGVYANANGRMQMARDWAIGGNASLRIQNGTAFLVRSFVDVTTSLGQTHLQLSREHTDNGTVRTNANADFAFRVSSLARSSLSLGVDDERSATAGKRSDVNVGLSLGYNLLSNVNFDATARARRALRLDASAAATSAAARTSLDAFASLNWAASPGWLFALTYGDSRGQFDLPISLDPLQPVVAPTTRATARYLFASVSYQYASGRSEVPIGGRIGSPAGGVSGIVFLDDNDNGRQDANEAGAPNVQVLLDGRFSTRTDGHGRFEFPFVASGEHHITVPSENLPLPWTVALERRSVQIRARSTETIAIPATRLR